MDMTILIAIIAASIFAASGYLKSSNFENFEVTKFAATVIVGMAVGAIMYASGLEVTESNVMAQLAAYVGVIAVVENILKAILRRF